MHISFQIIVLFHVPIKHLMPVLVANYLHLFYRHDTIQMTYISTNSNSKWLLTQPILHVECS